MVVDTIQALATSVEKLLLQEVAMRHAVTFWGRMIVIP